MATRLIRVFLFLSLICSCIEGNSAELLSSGASSAGVSLCDIDPLAPIDFVCIQNGHPPKAPGVRDLAGSPTFYDQVWGIGYDSSLVSVRASTAALLTTVSLPLPADNPILTLAINPTNDNFYGTTVSELFKIDPDTSHVELIGQLGRSVEKGLAFDNGGALYGISDNNQLVTIDTSTGTTELVGQMALSRMEDIAFDPIDNRLYGVGHNPDGELNGYHLLRINSVDATLESLGKSRIRPSGLAFVSVAPCQPSSGDLDRDGTVAFLDFLMLARQFGRKAHATSGDLDCDEFVGFADFLVLSGNFGKTVSGMAAVPEPDGCSAFVVAGLTLLAVRLRCRRHR